MAVVYAARSRALAQLEKRVHCNGVAPVDQALVRLEIDSSEPIENAHDLGLRADWRSDIDYTRAFGNDWLRKHSALGMWVPSFVEPREFNFLLNPSHARYQTAVTVAIEADPFVFDPRLCL
jgi:RES domain-containing protein